jgi:hypothetical protein
MLTTQPRIPCNVSDHRAIELVSVNTHLESRPNHHVERDDLSASVSFMLKAE